MLHSAAMVTSNDTYRMVWTVMNWIGVKSMARRAIWFGLDGALGLAGDIDCMGELAGYDLRGGTC